MSPLLVHDVLTHEADIRGALGAGRPPEAAWNACLQMAPTVLSRRLSHLGRLTILAGDHRFTAGDGEPATTLEVDPYELWLAARPAKPGPDAGVELVWRPRALPTGDARL